MGVFYCVVPLDAEIRPHILAAGATVPESNRATRNPTPREIRNVCSKLTDIEAHINSPLDRPWQVRNVWQAVLGDADYDHHPWTRLNVHDFNGREDQPHSIWFEKGWPSLILRVVHALSVQCGPLVVWPDMGDPPIVVSATDTVAELLRSWQHTRNLEQC
jgi:hypothetical protein